MKTRLFVFFAVQVAFAGIGWLGGYDFDHRSPDVASAVAASIAFGLIVALFPYPTNKKP